MIAARFRPGDRVLSPSGAPGVVYSTSSRRPAHASPMPVQVCRVVLEGGHGPIHFDARSLQPAAPNPPGARP